MTDNRNGGAGREREFSLGDLVDLVGRRIVTAVVIGSGIIGLAIYARPAPPRYQAVVADGQVFRVDTRSGTILSCVEDRCSTVVRHGQSLVRRAHREAPPKADAPPQLPAPAAAPAPAAEPAPR
jgi:hypothetical protein